jgi:hypothetical protein
MCDCDKCIPIVNELNQVIDSGENLKSKLTDYMYYSVRHSYKKGRCIEIGRCPYDTDYLCETFNTETMGIGVRSLVNITPETVIGCYMGCIKKSGQAPWVYAFEYGLKSYVIDGSDKRSIMSYVNHSQFPNLNIEYVFHIVNGKKQIHIIFRTNQYVYAGEELFIDYGEDYWAHYNKIENRSSKKQRKITDYFFTS